MSQNVPNPEDFQDPLENYEPKTYSDPLEEALAEKTVGEIQHDPYAAIPPSTPVKDAVKLLADRKIACLMVAEGDRLVGVFSDRDVLNRVALESDAVSQQPVSTVMTANPVFVYDTDSTAAALSVMAVSGYRHVPVLNLDGQIQGIVSPQRVTEFLHRFF